MVPALKRFAVAIPASVVSDTPHTREKTAKLGGIARASSIFGVTELILYPDVSDHDQERDLAFCYEILSYLETPQYLRKRLFKLSPTFRFTGILPPLQIPSHNVPRKTPEAQVGHIREGVVTSRSGRDIVVDAGLDEMIVVGGSQSIGERVTVRLLDVGKNLRGEIVDASKISIYWGYRVRRSKFKLGSLLEKERFDLRVGTSRYGTEIQEVWTEVKESLKRVESILIAFGSPKMGLREILTQESKTPSEVFDFFLNTVPGQQVATVRTEEALLVTLGIFNAMRVE